MNANPFAAGGSGAPGGYTGLGGILQFLGNGINQGQMDALTRGATGADGLAVGGAHGAFAGLSPWAAHWLATSGILQKKAPTLTDTAGLSGDDLFRATLQNSLAGMAPTQYTLHSGIDANFLTNLLANGIGGHSAYAKGFGATGKMIAPGLAGGVLKGGSSNGRQVPHR